MCFRNNRKTCPKGFDLKLAKLGLNIPISKLEILTEQETNLLRFKVNIDLKLMYKKIPSIRNPMY